MRKHLAALGVALLLSASGSVLAASSAGATAVGYASFPKKEFCIGSQCFSSSSGVLGHSIIGSGKKADSQNADAAGTSLCYTSFDFTRYNGTKLLSTSTGVRKAGCHAYNVRHDRNFTFPSNVTKSCAVYRNNGTSVVSQCHGIG